MKELTANNYSAAWAESAVKDAGAKWLRSDMPKSQLYLEGLPLFTRGLVSIPNHPQLLRELRLLERRTTRNGRDSVDASRGLSEDHANALFGAMRLLTVKAPGSWIMELCNGRLGPPVPSGEYPHPVLPVVQYEELTPAVIARRKQLEDEAMSRNAEARAIVIQNVFRA